MTTRVTEGARRERHNAYFIGSGYAGSLSFFFSGCRYRFSRLAASPLNALARALPLLNLKQKRDCSKSRIDDFSPACKNRKSCKVD